MRPRRLLPLAVALALAGPALPGVGAPGCPARRTGSDGWTAITPDAFDDATGQEEIAGAAVSPRSRDLLYVHNGASVQRSTDGGCTWTRIHGEDTVAVGQLLLPQERRSVAALVVPPRDPRVLHLALTATTDAGVDRPVVLTSTDRGETFRTTGTGLPVTGRAVALAPGQQAAVAYLVVDGAGPTPDVYTTGDTGASWSRTGPLPGGDLANIVVDPRVGARLWAVLGGVLHRSDDAGATWRTVSEAGAAAEVVAATTPDSTRLLVRHADRPTLARSDDAGGRWRDVDAPGLPSSLTALDETDVHAVAGAAGVHVVLPGGERVRDVTPDGERPTLVGLSRQQDGVDLVGWTPRAVRRVTLDGALRPVRAEVQLPPVDLAQVPVTQAGRPRLLPDGLTVDLRPGEVQERDVLLDLPATPTPLDVVFLVDTTGSMGGTIAALRSGIGDVVGDLARAGIDVHIGLGEFKEYGFEPWSYEGDYPYRLLRKVGPADDDLAEAIERLEASGGGDGPESGPTALFQAATGAGQVDEDGEVLVARGQDAAFRPNTLRVVVTATDTTFHREPHYPGNTVEQAVAALRRIGAHHVGLAVSGGAARPDLEEVSEGTGTYAPKGVDCDGDRRVDVPQGAPLVCDIGTGLLPIEIGVTPVNIAPAILGLLRGVRDEAPVALTVADAPATTARVLTPPPTVNLRQSHRLGYRLRLSCPAGSEGTTTEAAVRAAARSRVLATIPLLVRCATVPLAAAPVVAADPPPQTNPNVQSNPQPNPQVQGQPGAAVQEDQQTELALATVDLQDDATTELAMSLLAGVALATAAGWAARSRHAGGGSPAWLGSSGRSAPPRR